MVVFCIRSRSFVITIVVIVGEQWYLSSISFVQVGGQEKLTYSRHSERAAWLKQGLVWQLRCRNRKLLNITGGIVERASSLNRNDEKGGWCDCCECSKSRGKESGRLVG